MGRENTSHTDPENKKEEHRVCKKVPYRPLHPGFPVPKGRPSSDDPEEVLIERNFLPRKESFDGSTARILRNQSSNGLTDILSPGHFGKKPSFFADYFGTNIRYKDLSINNTLKTLMASP